MKSRNSFQYYVYVFHMHIYVGSSNNFAPCFFPLLKIIFYWGLEISIPPPYSAVPTCRGLALSSRMGNNSFSTNRKVGKHAPGKREFKVI